MNQHCWNHQKRNSWRPIAHFGLSTLLLSSIGWSAIAQAKVLEVQPGARVFQKGGTIVPQSVLQACVGDVVKYQTRDRAQDFVGHFWVKTHSDANCTGNGGKMTGYFEEQGSDGQFCRGQMTMEFNGRGYHRIQWRQIQAAPMGTCRMAGKTAELFLDLKQRDRKSVV